MNLEIFEHIDEVLDTFEEKSDAYKLIAEEIKDYFEKKVFSESKYTLSMTYRVKTVESIREKLLRNSYISKYHTGQEVLSNFSDIIGLRIECKFIDDEHYVWELLQELFTQTSDGIYYSTSDMPKVLLKLSDTQPQKQKNGFDIYKIDGRYMLGRECVRFELQIKALVNIFWGEIEHKVIYKNNSYMLADAFVSDLMTSIMKSLNMIDSQLYVLYNRFKRAEEEDKNFDKNSNNRAIERFISKMLYDVFAEMMQQQIGFTIDFKKSCDAVVRYVMWKNEARDMEDYGRIMISIFNILTVLQDKGVRFDEQIELERPAKYENRFQENLISTITELYNVNYKWYLFFKILFAVAPGNHAEDLESFIRYYYEEFMMNRTFLELDSEIPWEAAAVREDMLVCISETVKEKRNIDCFCQDGMASIHRSLNDTVPMVIMELKNDKTWADIRETYLNILKTRLAL